MADCSGPAPEDLATEWTGVERDPTSARLAWLLHPGAAITDGSAR
jgi:hypothetical protein